MADAVGSSATLPSAQRPKGARASPRAESAHSPHGGPSESPWSQQSIPAWQPLLTARHIIIFFAVVGAVFIPVGVALLVSSNGVRLHSTQRQGCGAAFDGANQVKEVTQRYDDACGNQTVCFVDVAITDDMSSPIMVYYELTNFHQNQRLYVKSRSGTAPRRTARTRTGAAARLQTTSWPTATTPTLASAKSTTPSAQKCSTRVDFTPTRCSMVGSRACAVMTMLAQTRSVPRTAQLPTARELAPFTG
jgi:hypothetical protein